MARYVIIWSDSAKAEIDLLQAFYWPPIERAVSLLEDQAEFESRNRKQLRGADLPSGYPEPTWEQRVGPHRILYAVRGQIVTILRVILKGRRTLGEIL
jgi:mRNA-degrading endonuclease RelE of RelBE toxin-antitoxin system